MKKILIVDWLEKYGGAERVLTVLNKQFDFDKCFTLINIMSNSDLNRVFNGKKIKIVESNLRLVSSGFRYLFGSCYYSSIRACCSNGSFSIFCAFGG